MLLFFFIIVFFLILRNVHVNLRVAEGGESDVDIVTGNDIAINGTAKDLTLRGGEVDPKGYKKGTGSPKLKIVLVVVV